MSRSSLIVVGAKLWTGPRLIDQETRNVLKTMLKCGSRRLNFTLFQRFRPRFPDPIRPAARYQCAICEKRPVFVAVKMIDFRAADCVSLRCRQYVVLTSFRYDSTIHDKNLTSSLLQQVG
jgi:hypothetical protein